MELFLKTIGALNDETSLRILRFIDINKKVCACYVENYFDMFQLYVSKYLKILKESGFLKVERIGRWAYCSIKEPLDEFRKTVLKEINCLYIPTHFLKEVCEDKESKK